MGHFTVNSHLKNCFSIATLKISTASAMLLPQLTLVLVARVLLFLLLALTIASYFNLSYNVVTTFITIFEWLFALCCLLS